MAVNRDKPDFWKEDTMLSVDMYNDWFLHDAPEAYRSVREQTRGDVDRALEETVNMTGIDAALLRESPSLLPVLRMATCPPLARDRLIGLAGVRGNLVQAMEKEGRLPPRMSADNVEQGLAKITDALTKMIDRDIFVWLARGDDPTELELYRATTIVADRLCGAVANPILRNAQEKRQLAVIEKWLINAGYRPAPEGARFDEMSAGTFSFHMNVPGRTTNMPIDAVVMPKGASSGELPLLMEAKSAGDFTNVNKRRKEEAAKISQLRDVYGSNVRFILFLCGYFDSSYLGFEAAEGIDWVWEHRIDDLGKFGL